MLKVPHKTERGGLHTSAPALGIISTADVAKIWNCHIDTARRRLKALNIKPIRIGRNLHYPIYKIQKLLK